MAPLARFRDFWRRQNGSATAFSLYLILVGMLVGSFALDTSNVMVERTRLQMATDSAAHDALVTREFNSESAAIDQAISTAESNLPPALFGHPLSRTNVVFGTWDSSTDTFTAQSGSKTAVQVTMFRNSSFGNSVATYLMGLVGVYHFNLGTRAVFEVYYPNCLNQGMVAQGVVDIQSNDSYFNNFCIHSNTYVSVNSNNYWEAGTVVSMPDLSLLQMPNSGFDTNPGLEAALQQGSFHIRILDQLAGIIAGLSDPSSEYFQSYITDPTPITITNNKIDNTVVSAGHVYLWDCTKNSQISAGTIIQDMVIVANCEVNIGSGVVVKNAVLANTNTSDTSFSSPSGFQLGDNDSCASGGGGQLLTMGGLNVAAGLEVYGSQIITEGPNNFAANADGIQGASMISGGGISGTSNMNMANCPTSGMNEFQAEYFRMVQ